MGVLIPAPALNSMYTLSKSLHSSWSQISHLQYEGMYSPWDLGYRDDPPQPSGAPPKLARQSHCWAPPPSLPLPAWLESNQWGGQVYGKEEVARFLSTCFLHLETRTETIIRMTYCLELLFVLVYFFFNFTKGTLQSFQISSWLTPVTALQLA